MKHTIVNALYDATHSLFDKLLGGEVSHRKVSLSDGLSHDVSGIVRLSGQAQGAVAVCMSRQLALKAAELLRLDSFTEINDDVLDVVGECANVVVGGAKSRLAMPNLTITPPKVVVGTEHRIDFPAKTFPIRLAVQSNFGPMSIEVGVLDAPHVDQFEGFPATVL